MKQTDILYYPCTLSSTNIWFLFPVYIEEGAYFFRWFLETDVEFEILNFNTQHFHFL